MQVTVKIPQAINVIKKCLAAGLVPMMHGSPGIGKSAVGYHIANSARLKMIDERIAQSDPTDAKGFPCVMPNGKAGYIPFEVFPLEGDPLPKDEHGREMNGWLLFLDEINSAEKLTQGAYYKIVLDHMVGQRKLHPRCFLIAAGNLVTDGAVVEPMSTALQSRMVHLLMANPSDDVQPWLDWAAENKIDHRITAYIGYKPAALYAFKPDHTDFTYQCNRTWEFVHKLIQVLDASDWQATTVRHGNGKVETIESNALIAFTGCITEGPAREFMAFCELEKDLPAMSDIYMNPEGTKVPREASVIWMLTGALANHINPDNAAKLLTYIKRLPIEFQIVTLKDAKRRNPQIVRTPAFMKWVQEQSTDLF